MNLVRVDELAQEIGISPDELFSQLKSMGFDVVNVTSSVERDLVEMVSDMLTGSAPKERDESAKRRIVSVRKGESEPEVEVRMEEALEEEDVEEQSEEEVEAPEISERLDDIPEEVSAQTQEVPAEGELDEDVPEEIPEGEPEAVTKKKKQIPLTTLAIEKDLATVGTEIPTARVIHQAEPAVPSEKPSKKTSAVGDTDKKVKGKKGKSAEEEEKSKKAAIKKGKKSTIKDIIIDEGEEFDVLTEDEEAAVDEPTLKVVEIKHSASPQPVRRKEQPRRRLRKSKKKDDLPEEETVLETAKPVPKSIRITAGLTVSDLAGMTGTKASEIIKILLQLGMMATINQTLDPDTAGLVVSELGFEVDVQAHSIDDLIKEEPDSPDNLVARPPVVTFRGPGC